MLEIILEEQELYSESRNEFLTIPAAKLQLEHSLISIYKWESKWHKPFLGEEKTIPEINDYVRCMTLNKGIDPIVYEFLQPTTVLKIIEYMRDPMTATTFSNMDKINGLKRFPNERVTAELIYYWMITLNIPVEFEKWHLEKLLTLIKVVNIKNTPPKKMSAKEAAMERARLNAQRRAKYNSKG